MSARKPAPVSLAPVGKAKRDPVAAAARTIRKFQSADGRRPDAPTPERLAKAGGAARVERFTEEEEVFHPGGRVKFEVECARFRVADDTLARLANGGFLARDPERNAALAQAGLIYRSAWRRATGGAGPAGVSWAERVDGGTKTGLLEAESSASGLHALRRMRAAIVPRSALPIVEMIVLEDGELVDAGRRFCGYQAQIQARTAALVFLTIGLEAIAETIGLIKPPVENARPHSAAGLSA